MQPYYNGATAQRSSKFEDLADLTQRLDAISPKAVYRSPELVRIGLFTPDFARDRRIIYVDGTYLGAQVVHHFSEQNDLHGRYSKTVDIAPVAEFFGVDPGKLLQAVGKTLQKVPVLEGGKIVVPYLYDLHGNLNAAPTLGNIEQYLSLVQMALHSVLRSLGRQSANDTDRADLRSEGLSGLWGAYTRYDSSKGEFEPYAMMRIKGAMLDAIRRNMPNTRGQARAIREMNESVRSLEGNLLRAPTEDEIAADMGTSTEKIMAIKDSPVKILSLDDIKDYGIMHEPADPSSLKFAANTEYSQLARQAVLSMPARERRILLMYYWENMTMQEIGNAMGVTESRISQIHSDAILKLRKTVKSKIQH